MDTKIKAYEKNYVSPNAPVELQLNNEQVHRSGACKHRKYK